MKVDGLFLQKFMVRRSCILFAYKNKSRLNALLNLLKSYRPICLVEITRNGKLAS